MTSNLIHPSEIYAVKAKSPIWSFIKKTWWVILALIWLFAAWYQLFGR